MISLKINLAALKHGLVKGKKDGELLICIPIKENELYKSEKGNIYLDVVGFKFEDKSDKEYKDTHLLKQHFSIDRLNEMTENERRAIPILGNARVAEREPEPNSPTSYDVSDDVNDLPF